VAARTLLEARKPIAYVVEEDEDGNPVYDPSKRYGRFVAYMPRPMSKEEWLREFCSSACELPLDPVEIEERRRDREEKRSRQCEAWLRRFRGFEASLLP
jgi:hypothetical protein